MSTASRGRALEHEVRKLFIAAGWDVVRGAGSKGKFTGLDVDLVASKITDKLKREVWIAAMQCKLTSNSKNSKGSK